MTDYDLSNNMKIWKVHDAHLRDILTIASRKSRDKYKYSLRVSPSVEDNVRIPVSVPYSAVLDASRMHAHIRDAADTDDITAFDDDQSRRFVDRIIAPFHSHGYYEGDDRPRRAGSVADAMRNRGTMYNYSSVSTLPGDYNVYAYAWHIIDRIHDNTPLICGLFGSILMESKEKEYTSEFAAQVYMLRLDSEKQPRSTVVNLSAH